MAKACTYQPLSSLYFIAEGDFAISDHYCYYHMFQINQCHESHDCDVT